MWRTYKEEKKTHTPYYIKWWWVCIYTYLGIYLSNHIALCVISQSRMRGKKIYIYIVGNRFANFSKFSHFFHSLKDNNVAEICLKSKRNVAWFIIVNIWYIASVIIVKQYFYYFRDGFLFLFFTLVILLLIYFKINFRL